MGPHGSNAGIGPVVWTRRKEQQLAMERRIQLRDEKIEKLDEFAGHGFRYGGSSSAIGKMKQKKKESEKLREEGNDEADQMAASSKFLWPCTCTYMLVPCSAYLVRTPATRNSRDTRSIYSTPYNA